MGFIEGDVARSAWWYKFIGPKVRDIVLAVEVIQAASLLEDEAVANQIVAVAARHLEASSARLASDPMPAMASIREHFLSNA